jgi:hypothetical protein
LSLSQLVNTRVEAAFRERSRGVEHLKAEILRLEREAGNLVRFLAEGGESARIVRKCRPCSGRAVVVPQQPAQPLAAANAGA